MNDSVQIKVGVVGGIGYIGVELLCLLVQYFKVFLIVVIFCFEVGSQVYEFYLNLWGYLDLEFIYFQVEMFFECDLVFFVMFNGVVMKMVLEFLCVGVKIIDLVVDFCLQDFQVWEKWYGIFYVCVDVFQ